MSGWRSAIAGVACAAMALAQAREHTFRLGERTALALDAEVRLRANAADRVGAGRTRAVHELLLRGLLGAELRWGNALRLRGQLGTGQACGPREPVPASVDNDIAVQQLFAAGVTAIGPMHLQVIVGRQEFAEGPRQLLSVGDGPNLHRTWNGVRLVAKAMASESVPGRSLGSLLRIAARFAVDDATTFAFGIDHLAAGDVLVRAGHGSATHVHFSLAWRF